MATRSDHDRWADLINALRLVATDAANQKRFLPELRVVAEQIRQGEPQAELLDVTLVRERVLPAEVALLVQRIDKLFDTLVTQDPDEAFSDKALRERQEWQLMRALAREALDRLGYPEPASRRPG
ncbi:MAG: hypothetical protein OXU20_24130 [Myxococcales bacterium]|nr:hypothetical protein [Myxococcales bacterium]